MLPPSALDRLLGPARAETPAPRPRAGYEATERTPYRQPKTKDLRPETQVADKKTRDQLASDGRELRRRSVQAAWCIRTHCTLVGEINFHSVTRNRPLDRAIEKRVRAWSKPHRCDTGGRHPLARLLWLAEMGATCDGDALLVMNAEGAVHVIPGPRIGVPDIDAPKDVTKETHPDGVAVDDDGRPVEYIVCTIESKGGRLRFSVRVPAEDAHLHARYDSPDQVRGVSPLAAALAPFQHLGDAQTLALARIKLEQLLGLKITRKEADVADDLPEPVPMEAGEDGDGEDEKPAAEEKPGYEIDLSKGIITFDGDPGDDFDLVQGVAPHSNVREYLREMLSACMKALSLDYSFYDSSHANYSASRNALALWQRMSAPDRERVMETAMWCVHRWLAMDVEDGLLALPAEYESVEDLECGYVAGGVGWGDVAKESRGYAAVIEAGLSSRQEVTRKVTGRDWMDVVEELAAEQKEIDRLGLATGGGKPDVLLVDLTGGDDDEDEENNPPDARRAA